ncbi:MAG: Hsp33 family molecular chaperone HslO [Eubacteriales bacterium]|nr:Hsp33 family molecular chaperone HslO [Eubacteriales bacterium]
MDNIAIAITNDGALRVYAAITTDMVRQAQKLHNSYPVATAALGRTLTGAAMMGAMLKNPNGSITIQIKGDGPLGLILAVTDADSNVRGYASNPDVDLPLRKDGKIDVGGGVGTQGYISVTHDHGVGEPYSGTVKLVSGEIAEDLTAYYAQSEQTPTAIGLGVLVGVTGVPEVAGGFLVQLMPGRGPDDDKILAKVEENIKNIPSITKMISSGFTTDDIIGKVLEGIEHNVLEHRKTGYRCNCSLERVERVLMSIGAEELKKLMDEGGETEVNCSFCDKKYTFDTVQLQALIRKTSKK